MLNQNLRLKTYLKPISDDKSFEPCQASTVFYPEDYKETYAPEGDFAKTLAPFFSVTGNFDPQTKITTLNMWRKALESDPRRSLPNYLYHPLINCKGL